jgi:hypothetical protein
MIEGEAIEGELNNDTSRTLIIIIVQLKFAKKVNCECITNTHSQMVTV